MRYQAAVVEFIIENHKGSSYRTMSEKVKERFGIEMTQSQVKGFYANHKLNSGLTGRFEKGGTPYTKGKKQSEYMSPEGIENSKATRFAKGNVPQNHRPVGSERVSVDGYIEVKVEEPNKWRQKHRIVWEEHNGPISKDMMIIFLDHNKLNCDISNLEAIDRGTHAVMCHMGLYTESPELTKVGITYSKLSKTISKKKKKGKHEPK